jgi:hypothetical protein
LDINIPLAIRFSSGSHLFGVLLKYLCLFPITNDGRCTCEIKSRIAMVKAAFNKKKNLFTSTLDLNLRNKLVKCYIWSMALYVAETWTLRAADQKHLEVLKCGAEEGWRRSVGPIM